MSSSRILSSLRFRRGFLFVLFLCFVVACSAADPSKSNDFGGNNGPVPDGGPGTPGQDADSGPDIDESKLFRVATFNVQRFFDSVCDSGNCGNDEFERDLSPAEFDFRAQQIADAIRDMEADAVLLQELETEACLAAIHGQLEDLYPVSVFGETGFVASLDVAVLASGELLETRTHGNTQLTRPDGSTTSFSREFLEVHVSVREHRIVLFDAHFKAKRNDDPGRRFAEAVGARQIVSETVGEFPEALVVMGGDLNDTPESETIQALTQDDVLRLVTEPNPEAFPTFRFSGEEVAIDHLLLARTQGGTLLPMSATILRDTSGGLAGSDHSALAADFILE